MRAQLLLQPKRPLVLQDVPKPVCGREEVLLKVHACGVCRTDLHIAEGDLPTPKLPLILGHEIVGTIVEMGSSVQSLQIGDRVGVPWLYHTCGGCPFCLNHEENLCDHPLFTGYTHDGGFAEYALAHSHYLFPIPPAYSDLEAAPLLCSGLIGYRAYSMVKEAKTIAFYGFGASAHLLLQIAEKEGKSIFIFSRKRPKPQLTEPLDAAIIFAPVGELVVEALKNVKKGGKVVLAGIHMSDIPSFPYHLIWGEKSIQSVANLTRKDGEEFMGWAEKLHFKTEVTAFPLEKANEALQCLKEGRCIHAVITPS